MTLKTALIDHVATLEALRIEVVFDERIEGGMTEIYARSAIAHLELAMLDLRQALAAEQRGDMAS